MIDSLIITMTRAARTQVDIDLRYGNPVSADLVNARAADALALHGRLIPGAAPVIVAHEETLRSAYRGAYRGEISREVLR